MTTWKQPKLYIVDDDESIGNAVSRLGQAMQLDCTVFHSAEELLAFDSDFGHGCIVLDIKMPGMTGLELQRRLKEREGYIPPVIIISAFADVPSTVEAFAQGAITLLEKPFTATELRREIEIALAYSTEQIEATEKHAAAKRAIDRLSAKELEVLDFLVHGESNKTIAGQLGLSVRAIEDRRRRLLGKLKARSVAEAVAVYFEAQQDYHTSPVEFRHSLAERVG